MAIQTVAVVGASGNVGVFVVRALLATNFKVTAVTRESSTATFPDGVEVRRADVSSVESLTAAFEGHDAVVSTVATPAALGGQQPLVDAAVAAGVKRFLPSEFGHNVTNMKGQLLEPLINGKTKVIEYVTAKAKENPSFTWTGISTSLFFDWGLDVGSIGINLKEKKATIYDSGDTPASMSSLDFVGRAVAAVLQREAETANKYLNVVQFNLTQNEVLRIFEEETGAKFAVTNVKTADLVKTGQEALAKGEFGAAFFPFLLAYNYTDGQSHAIPDEDNARDMLGLPRDDPRAVIKEYIKSRSS